MGVVNSLVRGTIEMTLICSFAKIECDDGTLYGEFMHTYYKGWVGWWEEEIYDTHTFQILNRWLGDQLK